MKLGVLKSIYYLRVNYASTDNFVTMNRSDGISRSTKGNIV